MKELFSIPGVSGIIVKKDDDAEYILIQERSKPDAKYEDGLLEIPAGKIREYENIFDCLRREILEETGLVVERIEGEERAEVIEQNGYKVINYEPFSSSQNIRGIYPIMVQAFICHLKRDEIAVTESNESKNIRWEKVEDIKRMIEDDPAIFYPMHITALKKYCKKIST